MSEHREPIPSMIYNAAVGGHVTNSQQIIDENENKEQSQINAEVKEVLGTGGSVDERIAEEGAKHYLKEETYSKSELNNMITTPNQEYVSVTATVETTVVTDVLPAIGTADTTYRVGNWDGTQYNDSVFSEYAWNGSAYIKLSMKSQVGEIYDISANHANTKYADLAAALDRGNNIPKSLHKGGISIKFVQSSNNKYAQYRLMSDSFNTILANWQGVDDKPTVGSNNLITSGAVVDTIEKLPSVYESYDAFSVEDEHGNTIVKFGDGHIKTNKFDSRNIYNKEEINNKVEEINNKAKESVITKQATSADLDITDEAGNVIGRYKDGVHLTKYPAPYTKDTGNDLSIEDENGNKILNIKEGYPHTKNFNGEKIVIQNKNTNDYAFGTKIEDLNDHHEVLSKIAGLTKRTPMAVTYNTGGNKPLVLLHFSDIHNAHFELSRIKSFKDRYSKYIDDVLSTGDNLYDKITDSFPWGENGAGEFLNTIGNHDAFNGEGIATAQECYNKEFKDFISDWGVEYTEGLCYYYKDYKDSKVRLIVLDCMHFDDAQKSWFANILEDARTHTSNEESDPYAVVVANHYPIEDMREAKFVESTFCSKMFRDEYYSFTSGAAAIVDVFQNNGGDFVCWLTGHTHKDYMTNPVSYPNQLVITIDSLNVYALESDTQRIIGTKSQDLFNLVAINTTGKTVSLARIGAEYDVYMRHKGVFCWDYSNHQIIYNN